jgi:hypothetical protein
MTRQILRQISAMCHRPLTQQVVMGRAEQTRMRAGLGCFYSSSTGSFKDQEQKLYSNSNSALIISTNRVQLDPRTLLNRGWSGKAERQRQCGTTSCASHAGV